MVCKKLTPSQENLSLHAPFLRREMIEKLEWDHFIRKLADKFSSIKTWDFYSVVLLINKLDNSNYATKWLEWAIQTSSGDCNASSLENFEFKPFLVRII